MPELQDAVTQLEAVFPARFVDDCYTDGGDEANALRARLVKIPRAALSPGDVEAYCGPLVSSDARGSKYVLPRAAALLTEGAISISNFASLFSGAKVVTWPMGERAAVELFLLAHWRQRLAAPEPEVKEYLLGIESLGLPLSSFLSAWSTADSAGAMRALARVATSFWSRPFLSSKHQRDVSDWLLDEGRAALASKSYGDPELVAAHQRLTTWAGR